MADVMNHIIALETRLNDLSVSYRNKCYNEIENSVDAIYDKIRLFGLHNDVSLGFQVDTECDCNVKHIRLIDDGGFMAMQLIIHAMYQTHVENSPRYTFSTYLRTIWKDHFPMHDVEWLLKVVPSFNHIVLIGRQCVQYVDEITSYEETDEERRFINSYVHNCTNDLEFMKRRDYSKWFYTIDDARRLLQLVSFNTLAYLNTNVKSVTLYKDASHVTI